MENLLPTQAGPDGWQLDRCQSNPDKDYVIQKHPVNGKIYINSMATGYCKYVTRLRNITEQEQSEINIVVPGLAIMIAACYVVDSDLLALEVQDVMEAALKKETEPEEPPNKRLRGHNSEDSDLVMVDASTQ